MAKPIIQQGGWLCLYRIAVFLRHWPYDLNTQINHHLKTEFAQIILFVWFLKEKGLINKDLFELEELKKLIVYEKNSSFYKAILQNLFFATLNCRKKNGGWLCLYRIAVFLRHWPYDLNTQINHHLKTEFAQIML
jgi:hypothetical protein